MNKNAILEKVVERAAISATSVLLKIVSDTLETVLTSVVGKNEKTAARIDDIVEKISGNLMEIIKEKIEGIFDFDGNDKEDEPEKDAHKPGIGDKLKNLIPGNHEEEKPGPDDKQSLKDIIDGLKNRPGRKPPEVPEEPPKSRDIGELENMILRNLGKL